MISFRRWAIACFFRFSSSSSNAIASTRMMAASSSGSAAISPANLSRCRLAAALLPDSYSRRWSLQQSALNSPHIPLPRLDADLLTGATICHLSGLEVVRMQFRPKPSLFLGHREPPPQRLFIDRLGLGPCCRRSGAKSPLLVRSDFLLCPRPGVWAMPIASFAWWQFTAYTNQL